MPRGVLTIVATGSIAYQMFQRMNAVYTPFFPEPRPARATVGVARLVGTAKIEISVTAWKKQ